MEGTFSSEMAVDFQRATWSYILQNRTFHNHRCENLKSKENVRRILDGQVVDGGNIFEFVWDK
jgi:hypothetical protein